jgi:hypothetical protein
MIYGMLPCTAGALILFAVLSAGPATLLCHAQNSAAVFPVRYHLGDGPRLMWADPRFDDSAWPIAQHDQWPMPPFYSDGIVWVRMRIPVRTDAAGPLAVRSSRDSILGGLPFGLADQVYVNGVLAGAEGSFQFRVRLDPQRDAVFDLPPSAATPGTQAVVALRIWIPPGLRRPANLGTIRISIDASRNLELAQRAAHVSNLYANSLDLALDIGIAILGLGMLVAWRWTGERDLLVFAWVMIPQALVLLAWNPTLPGANRLPFQAGALLFFVPLTLFMIALVWLNWTVHRLHAPVLKRLAQAAAVVFNLSLLLPQLFTTPHALTHAAMQTVLPADLFFESLLVAVNIWAIAKRRTNPLLALALLANPAVALLSDAGIMPFGVMVGPFYEHTFALSDFVIDFAIFVLLSQSAWKAWRARDELRVEFQAAREVQQQLVTPAVDVPGFRIQSAYLPAKQVGGDFFRVLPGGDGSVLIVVGDVSGKGLKAAMTVSAIMGALRGCPSTQPAEILAYLNHVLYGQIGGFVTCCVALIANDGAMTIANAGNPAPYCNGEEMPIESGLPLGMIADADYAEMRCLLAERDRLTFVSDGVIEATDSQGELYGFERTQAISTESPENVAQTAQAFGQQDDITVLTLTRAAILNPVLA